MGAPKIKIYQLPAGYSEDGDTDVVQAVNDELLPLRDKPVTPEDFFELFPAGLVTEYEVFKPFNFSAGKITSALIPPSGQFQAPATGHTDIFTNGDSGFEPVLKDHLLNVIAPSGYSVLPSGIQFMSAPPYPSGVSIEYWRSSPEPSRYYASANHDWYDGSNWMFRHAINDSDGDSVSRDSYTLYAAQGAVFFDDPMASPVMAPSGVYAYRKQVTKYFIGDHENWIENHLYLNPDIFKGTYDYPGDDSGDAQNNPIPQGPIPKYLEQGDGYAIDFRRGLVIFSSEFDSEEYPVHASFACIVGIRNVTDQVLASGVLSPSGIFRYKALADNIHPESIGSRWVGRDDDYIQTLVTVEIDGERVQKPQTVTVSPYDDMKVKAL